eukprot:RCo054288
MIHLGDGIGDVLAVFHDLLVLGDAVAVVVRELWSQDFRGHDDISEGLEEDAVLVVRDAATVLDLADHVLDRVVVHGLPLLGVIPDRGEMVLHELHAGAPVTEVVLVRDAPSDGSELPALLHNGVQEAHREQQGPPLHTAEVVKEVLGHPAVAPQHPCAHPLRRLIGELQADLQKADREQWVGLRGQPQPALLVDRSSVHLHQDLLQLAQEGQPKVAVLAHHPLPVGEAGVHHGTGGGLLPLAHANRAEALLVPLRQALDLARGVTALAQQEHHGHQRVALLQHVLEVKLLRLGVPCAQGGLDVVHRSEHGAVLAQRPHQEHPVKGLQAVVQVRDLRVLRALLVPPLPPHAVVPLDEVGQVLEGLHRLREGDAVEPGLIGNPHKGLGPGLADIQRGTSLEQGGKAGRGQGARAELNLARHQQHKHHLVLLKQPATDVAENAEGNVVDDRGNSLGGQLVPLRLVNPAVVQ